jgi:cell division protein YceG involved in septum cleavage
MTINVSGNNKRSTLSRDSRIIVVIVSIIFIICAAPGTMVIGQETVSQMQDTEIDPAEVSIQITQAKDHIENELNNQGNILRNEIIEQFSFNDVQAQLSQGYQYFIAGNVSAGVTQVEMANEILENTNIAMLQSGQE